DDPLLALLDVPVGVLQQSEDEVLDVLPDVAGLGQRRRVADRERYVEDARERPREQGLPAARGADQEDVALLDFDVVERDLRAEPLVVVVDGDREDLLRALLRYDVLVEPALDLERGRERPRKRNVRDAVRAGRLLLLVAEDRVAEVDALVADVHS